MDEHYNIECDLCESVTEVIVDSMDGAEPEFCPMCGTPIIAQ
jgi:hypothetical protein|tara:strand:+ start:1814 stop:1939 length:126 start_codon:yes stop_codon:yes gene_type:complete